LLEARLFNNRPTWVFTPRRIDDPDFIAVYGEALAGLSQAMRLVKFDVGKEFDVVTVSFDPTDTPALAAAKKAEILKRYKRPGAENGWHFLTGSQESITALTTADGTGVEGLVVGGHGMRGRILVDHRDLRSGGDRHSGRHKRETLDHNGVWGGGTGGRTGTPASIVTSATAAAHHEP